MIHHDTSTQMGMISLVFSCFSPVKPHISLAFGGSRVSLFVLSMDYRSCVFLGQNPEAQVNTKIVHKWIFIPPKYGIIGVDP